LADRDDQNRQPLLVTAIESVTPAYKVTTRKCDSELRITECRIFVTEYSRICATHRPIDLDRFVGRRGALIKSMPFDRRVADSNLALTATHGPWTNRSLA